MICCGRENRGFVFCFALRLLRVRLVFSWPQFVCNTHMFRKMKLAPSPTCNCGLEDQTAEHILQSCPLLQTASTNVWPKAVYAATHQTLRQQGGTGEDSYIHPAMGIIMGQSGSRVRRSIHWAIPAPVTQRPVKSTARRLRACLAADGHTRGWHFSRFSVNNMCAK